MVGLDHGANQPDDSEHPGLTARNTRYGLVLFTVYLLIYSAYVLINAFAPELMERSTWGVTWAILSGFGLILAAFVLALLYGWLCRASANGTQGKDDLP